MAFAKTPEGIITKTEYETGLLLGNLLLSYRTMGYIVSCGGTYVKLPEEYGVCSE